MIFLVFSPTSSFPGGKICCSNVRVVAQRKVFRGLAAEGDSLLGLEGDWEGSKDGSAVLCSRDDGSELGAVDVSSTSILFGLGITVGDGLLPGAINVHTTVRLKVSEKMLCRTREL